MKTENRSKLVRAAGAFTLVELLVVISIIALLMAITATGFSKIHQVKSDLSQKAHFHGIEVGLEVFSQDFDGYPESSVLNPESDGGSVVTGAQRLAEAMFGRDMQGFDPVSEWGAKNQSGEAYDGTDASLNRRKRQYMPTKNVGVHHVTDLYETPMLAPVYATDASVSPQEYAPVITEVYSRKKVTLAAGSTAKVGYPVLYFKANTSLKVFSTDPAVIEAGYKDFIYNYDDNKDIFELGNMVDQSLQPDGKPWHHFDKDYTDPAGKTGIQLFYEAIKSKATENYNFKSPYNPTTFILMAPGADGIFGTRDDLTNFD